MLPGNKGGVGQMWKDLTTVAGPRGSGLSPFWPVVVCLPGENWVHPDFSSLSGCHSWLWIYSQAGSGSRVVLVAEGGRCEKISQTVGRCRTLGLRFWVLIHLFGVDLYCCAFFSTHNQGWTILWKHVVYFWSVNWVSPCLCVQLYDTVVVVWCGSYFQWPVLIGVEQFSNISDWFNLSSL